MSTPSIEHRPGARRVEAGDQPEQRRLAAARRPDDGDELTVRDVDRERMKDGQRLGAAHDRLRDLAQLDHDPAAPLRGARLPPRSIGSSTAQTLSATMRAPSAVGWMPSRWFSDSMPATPSSRNGTSAHVVLLRQRRDTPGERRRCSRAPKFGGASMPGEHHRDAARLRPLDDLRQVAAQLVDRQAAQAVVAAERDDQHAHVAFERPVEPAQAAGRRVAGDAGVDDLVVEPCGIEPLLQQRRIRLALVADRDRRSGCRRARRRAAGVAAGAAAGRQRRDGRLALAAAPVARRSAIAAAATRSATHAATAAADALAVRTAEAPMSTAAAGNETRRRAQPAAHERSAGEAAVNRASSSAIAASSIWRWCGEEAPASSARARASASSIVWRRDASSRSAAVSARATRPAAFGRLGLLKLDVLALEASRHGMRTFTDEPSMSVYSILP